MKIKRHKKFQRNVKFFIKHFDWKPPFHLLIDGTFAKAALDNKVNLRDQLPKYFDNPIKLYTSPCCLVETESIGPELYGALQVLKSFFIHKCPHAESSIPAAKCIKSLSGVDHLHQRGGRTNFNRNVDKDDPAPGPEGEDVAGAGAIREADVFRFIPATQDHVLRKQLRHIAGVPLVYLNGPAPAFERPSRTSQEVAHQKGVKKLEVLHYQKEILNKMKEEAFGNSPIPVKKGTKKRKPVGPNPLSCKKSKKKGTTKGNQIPNRGGPSQNPNSAGVPPGQGQAQSSTGTGKKKKRKRVRIPKHVKGPQQQTAAAQAPS